MRITCPLCHRDFIISPRRRQKHSNWFHMACARYATETGQTAENAKLILKYRYGVWIEVTAHTEIPDWTQAKLWRMYPGTCNEKLVLFKSESIYDKDEETQLSEGLKIEAFDAGVDLSDLLD